MCWWFLGINRFWIWVVCHAQTAVAAAAAAGIVVVIVIVSVVSIIIVIVIAAATAPAHPYVRLFFHVVIIVCGTLHICPCGMCGLGSRVQQPACICGIIMRVLLKLQLQRKSHSNILTSCNMATCSRARLIEIIIATARRCFIYFGQLSTWARHSNNSRTAGLQDKRTRHLDNLTQAVRQTVSLGALST